MDYKRDIHQQHFRCTFSFEGTDYSHLLTLTWKDGVLVGMASSSCLDLSTNHEVIFSSQQATALWEHLKENEETLFEQLQNPFLNL